MSLYTMILAIYSQLYGQATIHSNYVHNASKQDRLLICRFIKFLRANYSAAQITEDLLIGYFEFGFSRYSGIKTPRGRNNIMLNWLIGEKAMRAWLKRVVSKRYYVKWRINKDFKLKLKLAFKSEVKVNNGPSFLNQLNQYEEQEKQRFHNTPQGYGYCAMMTTLYTPNSILCRSCKFKEACIERLKINFNNLYQKRIHGGLTNRIAAI